jgi:hypothetical protein
LVLAGCSSSTSPSFKKEEIAKAIEDICRDEYKLPVKSRLVGRTLWIYFPAEDLFVPVKKGDKPEKYTERFSLDKNEASFSDGSFKLWYSIKKMPADKEGYQQIKFNKDVLEKINQIWSVLRRVIFSTHRAQDEPQICAVVTSDIKNGYEAKDVFHHLDLRKVSYQFISWTEYQHRAIYETAVSPIAIGDKEGRHIVYEDIPLGDFLAMQMQNRLKLKFQKPEVERSADIDKEVLKIAVAVIKIYGFKDFNSLELYNSATRSRAILNQAAVQAKPID